METPRQNKMNELITIGFYTLLTLIFVRIAYVDYKEHAIYDIDNILAALLITAHSIYSETFLDSLIFGAIALLIGFCIFLIAYFYYGFEAFGLGDVLLFGVLGLLFAQDFLSYFSISLMISGFIIILLIPFLGMKKLNRLEIPMAPVLLFWVPIFIYFDKPSIILLLQKFL